MNRYVRAYIIVKALQNLTVSWIFSTYVIFLQSHGLSLFQANLLNFTFMMVSFFLATPSGVFADRVGQRGAYVLGVISWGGGMFVYAVGRSFGTFLLAESVAGVGSALMSESMECWLRNCTDDKVTHQAIGRAGAIGTFVGVIPSSLGSLLGVRWGLQWPWVLGGLCSAATCLIAFLVTKALGEGRQLQVQHLNSSETLKVLVASWNNPPVRLTILATLFANACFQPFNMFWGPILKQASGQEWWLGFVSIGVAVALALGSYLATVERLPTNGRGVALAIASVGLPMALPASFPRTIPILTFFLLHEIGRGALPPILFTYSNRHLKDKTRSTANSARVAASTLGRGVGLMISGFLTLYCPPLVIWRLSALALLVLSLYLWKKK